MTSTVIQRIAAPLRQWEERRALRAARAAADAELLDTRLPSPRLAWRTAELVSDENRVDLARSLTSVVHAADERLLPSASPIDRVSVRACRACLLELASRLSDLDRPVRPRGVVATERLLVDGRGPLYAHGGARRLRAAALRALEYLDDVGADGASG